MPYFAPAVEAGIRLRQGDHWKLDAVQGLAHITNHTVCYVVHSREFAGDALTHLIRPILSRLYPRWQDHASNAGARYVGGVPVSKDLIHANVVG